MITFGCNHVQVDKEVVKTGFGSKLRATIRHLRKKNKIHNRDTCTGTVGGEDLGVSQRGSTESRNMLYTRKSMRPTVVEFEDDDMLGDLEIVCFF